MCVFGQWNVTKTSPASSIDAIFYNLRSQRWTIPKLWYSLNQPSQDVIYPVIETLIKSCQVPEGHFYFSIFLVSWTTTFQEIINISPGVEPQKRPWGGERGLLRHPEHTILQMHPTILPMVVGIRNAFQKAPASTFDLSNLMVFVLVIVLGLTVSFANTDESKSTNSIFNELLKDLPFAHTYTINSPELTTFRIHWLLIPKSNHKWGFPDCFE